MVLETSEEAKKELLNSYDSKEELKDAIKTGDIEEVVYDLAESNEDPDITDRVNWLAKDYDNIELVNYACDDKSKLFDLIGDGQYVKNKESLYDAIDELKREYGIEKLHKHNGYEEKLNQFRKVYFK